MALGIQSKARIQLFRFGYLRIIVAEAGDSSGMDRKGNVRHWKQLPEDW
jgi:hypothetical protein